MEYAPVQLLIDMRPVKFCYFVLVSLCLIILTLAIVATSTGPHVWDDSYMFVRYADNLLAHGRLSWNPNGAPTYGLTSILYLVIVVPVRLATPYLAALTAWLASVLAGLVFISLLLLLVYRTVTRDRQVGAWLVLFVLLALALAIPQFATHLASGMDTTFALAFITAYFLIDKWYESCHSTTAAIAMGVWGGLALLARPDLLLYTTLVPLSIFVFAPTARDRRQALGILGITAVLVGLEMLWTSTYFGSPVPLPFYAKAMRTYQGVIYDRYAGVAFQELGNLIGSYWFLLILIGAEITLYFKDWYKRTSAGDKGILLASALFITFYAFFVLQIMPFSARFYYPVLPALLLLSSQSLVRLGRKLSAVVQRSSRTTMRGIGAIGVVILLVLLGLATRPVLRVLRDTAQQHLLGHFAFFEDYGGEWPYEWAGLETLSKLPDDMVIATTEIGVLSAANPRKTVVDMAGLNETGFAHDGFSAN
ncbi:MAG: hypothetical protein WCF84_23340, partial [Anaerolineae bacterium]